MDNLTFEEELTKLREQMKRFIVRPPQSNMTDPHKPSFSAYEPLPLIASGEEQAKDVGPFEERLKDVKGRLDTVQTRMADLSKHVANNPPSQSSTTHPTLDTSHICAMIESKFKMLEQRMSSLETNVDKVGDKLESYDPIILTPSTTATGFSADEKEVQPTTIEVPKPFLDTLSKECVTEKQSLHVSTGAPPLKPAMSASVPQCNVPGTYTKAFKFAPPAWPPSPFPANRTYGDDGVTQSTLSSRDDWSETSEMMYNRRDRKPRNDPFFEGDRNHTTRYPRDRASYVYTKRHQSTVPSDDFDYEYNTYPCSPYQSNPHLYGPYQTGPRPYDPYRSNPYPYSPYQTGPQPYNPHPYGPYNYEPYKYDSYGSVPPAQESYLKHEPYKYGPLKYNPGYSQWPVYEDVIPQGGYNGLPLGQPTQPIGQAPEQATILELQQALTEANAKSEKDRSDLEQLHSAEIIRLVRILNEEATTWQTRCVSKEEELKEVKILLARTLSSVRETSRGYRDQREELTALKDVYDDLKDDHFHVVQDARYYLGMLKESDAHLEAMTKLIQNLSGCKSHVDATTATRQPVTGRVTEAATSRAQTDDRLPSGRRHDSSARYDHRLPLHWSDHSSRARSPSSDYTVEPPSPTPAVRRRGYSPDRASPHPANRVRDDITARPPLPAPTVNRGVRFLPRPADHKPLTRHQSLQDLPKRRYQPYVETSDSESQASIAS